MVGKIVTEKLIHKTSLHSALANIWCNPKGFRIEEVVDKTFHFFCSDDRDITRILKGSPWIFRNSWLIIQPWKRDIELSEMEFRYVPLWVQLLGLPPHSRTKKMAQKIRRSIGEGIGSRLLRTSR